MNDDSEFSLFVISQSGSSVPILNEDYMLDVLNVAEKMSQMAQTATLKRHSSASSIVQANVAAPQGPAFYIVYKKKLWLNRKQHESDMVVTIQYHQLLESYLTGQLLSNQELLPTFLPLAAELAATQVAANATFDPNFIVQYVI